ncbi:hypothetical protein PAECIP111892_05036 [Paenibacillus auburnensis]|uniref:DUF3502 domain-containing protein n=1 Tax=Paenibacillus auburnensis TaxID=2905649 RepID=A0ABM9CT76_9BACL|nr:extracellular solute-binding protein [Paenibacillus auburnensis]CAH1221750.1 hypothetical protein PAECIP111892_05036 [Paenibacillus auburnensis]
MIYRKVRVLALVMLTLLIVFTSGCTGAETSEPTEDVQVVTLVGYLIGSPPAGLKDVLNELNAKLIKDLQVRIDLRYIGWGELAARYPLVLTSDDTADFIFASNWTYYTQIAAQGGFREITPEMMKNYMPLHYKATDQQAWEQAEIGGKIYMIPSASPDLKVPVTLIRGDLRKKYGLTEIKRFTDLAPYLEAVKTNEPNMVPIRVDKQYDFSKTHSNLQWELGPAVVDLITTTNGFSGVFTSWDSSDGAVLSIFDEPLKRSFLQAGKIVKDWYDRGYINHDAIANKVRSKDSFEQGLSAVAFGNSNDIQSTLANAEQKGWEVEIIPTLSSKGTYIADPFVNNGVALPADSKHAELTMRMLDLIMEDPVYSRLVYFGIEGKNYVLQGGEIAMPPGTSADKNDYPPDAAGFWFTNKSEYPPFAAWSEVYREHRKQIGSMLVPYRYSSFNFNAEPIKGELEQINQAAIQYLNPLLGGMVPDVNQAFNQMQKAVIDAGFPKVINEARRQAHSYMLQEDAVQGSAQIMNQEE